MVRQVATRSQRRTEKRQAVVLLALVLTVALVSFALGVMVGRSASPSAVAAAVPPPPRLPVAPPAPAAAAPLGERPAEGLTFYDALPKGEQSPLGSGINLPPARETAPTAAVASGEPAKPAAGGDETTGAKGTDGTDAEAPLPAKTAVPTPVPATKPAAKAVSPVVPAPAAGGYLVQAAAFRRSEDARALQTKLGKKGYAVFTEEAQLGEKGVWFRVYVGPYATAGAADAAVSRLKAEEKLSALVRRR